MRDRIVVCHRGKLRTKMDIPDIFHQIALRTDNETLSKLIVPQLWELMKTTLKKNNFWYERSVYLTNHSLQSRPDVEWRQVYYSLATTIESGDKIWSNLDYLPSISILEEVFGVPDWNEDDQEEVWREIKTPEVLTRLLELKYIKPSVSGGLTCLHTASLEGREQMIDPLVRLIEDQSYEENLSFDEGSDIAIKIDSCISGAAQAGHLSIVKLLLDHYHTEDEQLEILRGAMEGGHQDVIRYLLDRYEGMHAADVAIELDKRDILELILDKMSIVPGGEELLFWRAVGHGAVNTIQLLLDRDAISESMFNWLSFLEDAIDANQVAFVEYILKRDKKLKISSDMLKRAAHQGSKMLDILLRDPRSDSMFDVTTALLLSDKRVVTENLQPREVKQAEGSDIYSLILRFVLLKNPTPIELVDWMIDRRDKQLQEAARNVLHNVYKKPTWARTLMLCILYPKLSFRELIEDLNEEGASDNEIARAAQLVGAYLGESGIRSREERS